MGAYRDYMTDFAVAPLWVRIPKWMWGNACLSKVHSYRLQLLLFFFPSVNEWSALQAQNTSLAKTKNKKRRRLENGADFGTSCRAWRGWEATFRGQTGEKGAPEETPTERRGGRRRETLNDAERNLKIMSRMAATLCLVQWWWGLHMRSIKHLEALVIHTIDKCKKNKKKNKKTRLHQPDI